MSTWVAIDTYNLDRVRRCAAGSYVEGIWVRYRVRISAPYTVYALHCLHPTLSSVYIIHCLHTMYTVSTPRTVYIPPPPHQPNSCGLCLPAPFLDWSGETMNYV
jgi:hypothetical protein